MVHHVGPVQNRYHHYLIKKVIYLLHYVITEQLDNCFYSVFNRINLKENVGPLPLIIKKLDVENQRTQTVSCSITQGNENLGSQSLFSVRPTTYSKSCNLTLNSALDYEQKKKYVLKIRVDFANINTGRKKRQTYSKYI